ncbi:hypothetical protein DJ030_16890 [bacterium endosymbiont of Escarpia laminata]|nr:MAG: hypothetical protein DJ030_16890 [bacterium endosymbiont of Escarpia laminata]
MDDSRQIPLKDLQRHWLEHIQACAASGKGIVAYAAEHGLDAKAMYTGKKTLVKKGGLPMTHQRLFVRAQAEVAVSSSTWRIGLPNGVAVTFSGNVDTKTLSTVLTTVAAIA